MELSNSIQIPQIGLGVYKMEAGDEMNNAIGASWDAGYRLFDTAQMYRNEAALGDALKFEPVVSAHARQPAGIPEKTADLLSRFLLNSLARSE